MTIQFIKSYQLQKWSVPKRHLEKAVRSEGSEQSSRNIPWTLFFFPKKYSNVSFNWLHLLQGEPNVDLEWVKVCCYWYYLKLIGLCFSLYIYLLLEVQKSKYTVILILDYTYACRFDCNDQWIQHRSFLNEKNV